MRNVSVISENVTVITTKNAAMLSTPPLSWTISLARSRKAAGMTIAVKSAPPLRAVFQPRPSGIFSRR